MKRLVLLSILCAAQCLMAATTTRAALLVDPAGGTALFNDSASSDDAVSLARPIGFAFHFFGDAENPVTQWSASRNGYLNSTGDTAFQNVALPAPAPDSADASGPVQRICPLW